jgi:hypothetical protein
MSRFDDSIWSLISNDEDDQPYPYDEPFHYGERYLYDYQWYHEKFPEEWAVCHKEGTGPGQCTNCADYGSINGVFIGYCANCAMYDYEGTRGRGFIDVGVENSDSLVLEYSSAFDTYLKDVDIHAIEPIEPIEPIESEIKEPGDTIDDNDMDDDYPEDDMDVGVMNCHFEGGYNDF